MKAKNLVIVLAGVLGFLSCQKNEIVLTGIDNLGGTTSLNKLKFGSAFVSNGTPAIITFIEVKHTAEDNSVFSYQVTSGAKPAVSHWNLNIMPSLSAEGVAEVILLESSDPTTVYGKDGSLKKLDEYADLMWLKFDKPYKDGEIRSVTFTLQGLWYVGDILAISKEGNSYNSANLPGPVQIRIPILTIVTEKATWIGPTTAKVSGSITDYGGANITDITERGVCWSIYSIPTILDDKIIDVTGTGTETFTIKLTPLIEETTYYARAYASIVIGTYTYTYYGNEISFTTWPKEPR